MKTKKLLCLCEGAVMAALATGLSLVKIWEAPLGGAVTLCSMLPLIIYSYRRGVGWGVFAAFVYSAIQLLLGISTVSYLVTWKSILACCLIDYILAFTVVGVAGIFRSWRAVKNEKLNTALTACAGALVALIMRTACHIISGALVWYEITKAEMWNDYVATVGMWTYSSVYNLTYMIPESVITLVALFLVARFVPITKE